MGAMTSTKIAHIISEGLVKEITWRVIFCEEIILTATATMALLHSSWTQLVIGRPLRLVLTQKNMCKGKTNNMSSPSLAC